MNIINVYTNDQKTIVINGKPLDFDFNIPSIFPSNFFSLTWWEHENKYEYCTIEDGDAFKQTIHSLEGTEEDYITYVKPFVDQFENYIPNEAEIRAFITKEAQHYLDDVVCKLDYENILTACSYSNSTNEIFRTEGLACIAWRDIVWDTCYRILDEILIGNRPIPTIQELINDLPSLIIKYPDGTIKEFK